MNFNLNTMFTLQLPSKKGRFIAFCIYLCYYNLENFYEKISRKSVDR